MASQVWELPAQRIHLNQFLAILSYNCVWKTIKSNWLEFYGELKTYSFIAFSNFLLGEEFRRHLTLLFKGKSLPFEHSQEDSGRGDNLLVRLSAC